MVVVMLVVWVCLTLNSNSLFSSYFYYAPFVVVVLISVIPIPGDHKIARKSTKQSKVRVREHRKIKKYTRRQMLLYRHRHSHAPCTDNGVEM